MRMHTKFSRSHGGGSFPALGSDGSSGDPPTVLPSSSNETHLIAPFANNAGFPSHRIAVSYKGPGGAGSLVAQLWFYDYATEGWYQVGDPRNLEPNAIAFFDVPALAEPSTLAGGKPSGGSIAAMLVVDAGGAANGDYTFAMAPSLTVPSA